MNPVASFVPGTAAETLWIIRDRVAINGAVAGADLLVGEVTVPPMSGTPLHSHPSPETMRIISGELVFLTMEDGKPREFVARVGDLLQVPAGAPHGYQNRSGKVATLLAIFDASLRSFFRDASSGEERHGPPTAPEIDHVFATARAHGMTLFV